MKTKILIVEDEAIVAKDISVCLEKIGYEVVATFSKGEKALAFLEENKPDLVLMDIMLAGNISGIDTSARIKKDHEIPVVFLTSDDTPRTIFDCYEMEAENYLKKPVSAKVLLKEIAIILTEQKVN